MIIRFEERFADKDDVIRTVELPVIPHTGDFAVIDGIRYEIARVTLLISSKYGTVDPVVQIMQR